MLAAFAVGGWHLAGQTVAQVMLAIALPVAAATVWGLLLSPKARLSAPLGIRIALELVVFAVASALLWIADHHAAAVALLGGEVVVLVGLLVRGTPPGTTAELAG